MHEDLQGRIRTSLMDFADLFQGEFTCQYHLTEARLTEKANLLNGTIVHLRTGMQGDRGEVEHGDAHVLHDERIHPDAIELPDQCFRLL